MASYFLLQLAVLLLARSVAAEGTPSTTLVINEFDYDQPSTDYKEFVEILNISPDAINLSSYSLLLATPTGATYNTIPLSSYSLAAGAHYVVCSTNAHHVTPCQQTAQADSSQSDRSINLLRNTKGNSIAIMSGATIVDSVTYGGTATTEYTEGSPTLADASFLTDSGLSRCPNGVNTFNNYNDFSVESTTPGAPNSCLGSSPAPPPPVGTPSSPPPPSATNPPPAPSANFNFYFFVSQWAGSWTDSKGFCTDPKYQWASTSPMWTIHGLWPNYNAKGSYPSNCDPNYPFDISELDSALLADMSLYWPSFKCPASAPTFWAHEWNKHGTCAEPQFSLANDRTPQWNYFNQTIRMLRKQKVDVYTILQSNGILPNASYSKAMVHDAVANALGVSVVNLHCTGRTTLTEIWVCVSTSLQIVSCNPSYLAAPTCTGTTVFYPPAKCGSNGAGLCASTPASGSEASQGRSSKKFRLSSVIQSLKAVFHAGGQKSF